MQENRSLLRSSDWYLWSVNVTLIATVFALINSASHQTMTTVFFQARVWCHIDDDYVDSKVKMAITAAAAKPRRYTGLRVIILGYIQELHLPQNALKLKIKFRISSWEIFQTLFKGYSICPRHALCSAPQWHPGFPSALNSTEHMLKVFTICAYWKWCYSRKCSWAVTVCALHKRCIWCF